ncbi:DUF4914 domain-containing protein [Sporanaerobium hydrogeniformans]|uniref:DUF4914 domain-containing protein n=1 Tax=Sporanaerobium hydrogeniformans TaxID=3072179 RepID=A0AC61DCC2_9FIRM|nr:DUF4914 family protein [Sporanaerobium hydrogeniformans]PHV70405.1 DUF4914 domain-containing protein [Sporanaerobium hydrogeniformans]
MREILQKMILPEEVKALLNYKENYIIPTSREHLFELAMGKEGHTTFEVAYEIEAGKSITEADVVKCKNGIAVNYREMYMRRRDPDCVVIGDQGETDKPTYEARYGESFEGIRKETFAWLAKQELIVLPFMAGGNKLGYEALMIGPKNAAFFAAALGDLQGFVAAKEVRQGFTPRAIVYVAPPFRHTHFNGKQVVVHNRLKDVHEVFSYNLYPGPSAKKGIYGVLLNIGEQEGWVTLHASTVKVITPYENVLTIMHEGASGGGKSEMAEQMHKDSEGRTLLGKNKITGDKTYISLSASCELKPVTDDMAMCRPDLQGESNKLVVADGEEGWFLRVNHINEYGVDPHYEKLCTHAKEPLIFLNIEAIPNATCLIWEHIMDKELGKPCPNPRVIMPRRLVPQIVDEAVEVDIRSFGVRAPLCTKEEPTYGIMGLFHILPPPLAWLWRLVAPRGHANPSILDSEGMKSEGVGSYWPFATGKRVDQANLLLEQMKATPSTRYILIPNQHIGAYEVGFMSQWITREYLARRGSVKFNESQLEESRCPLLGYSLENLKVDGTDLPKVFLRTHLQPEVGIEGYDKGAKILQDFFKQELKQYLTPELHPLGRQIIECCLTDGDLQAYNDLWPIRF